MVRDKYLANSKKIKFNGVSSDKVGVVMETFPDYNYPARTYEAVHVPGMNGDIYLEDGTYANVQRVYRISAYKENKDFHQLAVDVVKWLHPSGGYKRLEDDYDPDAYRMAMLVDEGNLSNMLNMAGTATVTFTCKPQRFLKSGEAWVTVQSGAQIENAGSFESKPLIRLTIRNGYTATLGFGVYYSDADKNTVNTFFTIAAGANRPNVIYIDSELQEAYYYDNENKLQSANQYLILGSNRFPLTGPVKTMFKVLDNKGDYVTMEVQPRWWTL